jgi:hypothetical protein
MSLYATPEERLQNAEDSLAYLRDNILILEAQLAASQELCDELAEALKDMLFAAENADETGYVADVGFIEIDALYAKARAALARHASARKTI